MATPGDNTELVPRLLEQPQGFDLFQAISLLECEGIAQGYAALGSDGGPEAVRLSSHVSLGFEASDIRQARRGAATGEAFTLSTPVLSLLGQGGPLPSAFTELVIERNAAKDFATSDFLDILHHRLLSLFYLGRKRRRTGLGGATTSTVVNATRHACGMALSASSSHTSWLRHAGLLGGAPRSMASLCALLSDRYSVPFSGEQFVGGWQRLEDDELTVLGDSQRAPELGRTAMIGRRVWDQSAAIRLHADNLPLAKMMRLLPGGEAHEDFKATVRGFIPSALRVDVLLTPSQSAVSAAALTAGSGPRLSWNAWMGTRKDGDTSSLQTPAVSPQPAQPTPPARFSFECAHHEH